MFPIPELKGEKISLIPLEAHHFDALFLVASDPDIWEQHPDRYRYKKEVFQKYFDGAIASEGAYLVCNTEQEVIGCSRYYEVNIPNKLAIGYTFLAKKYWGGVYNAELKKLMMDYAFGFVNEIHFHVGAMNMRSRKALEKVGAIPIESKAMLFTNQEPQEHWVYCVKKNDYRLVL